MKRLASLLPAIFVLAFATDAGAAQRIVTPRLEPDADGMLVCSVVNASDKKEVMVEIAIYSSSGGVVQGVTPATLGPNMSTSISSLSNAARHCVVVVKKGGKKNVRVSLSTHDSVDNVTGAVSGF